MNIIPAKKKVTIVGNHFFYSVALESIINRSEKFELVSQVPGYHDLTLILKKHKPEIIFWNVSVKDNPVQHIQDILKIQPSIKIVCISTYDDGGNVKKMLEAGVVGFITTTSTKDCFNDMLNYVYAGKVYISSTASVNYTNLLHDRSTENVKEKFLSMLTKRELEVLQELIKGLACKQIAVNLCVSNKTIEVHIHNMMRKFNVKKSIELVAIAVRHQLV